MVNAAEADIIGPAVAAEDPAALLVEVVLLREYLGCQRACRAIAVYCARGLCLLHVLEHAFGLVAEHLLGLIRAEEGDAVVNGQDILFKLLDKGLGGFLVCFIVAVGVQPALCGLLELCAAAGQSDELLDLGLEVVADLLLAEVETEAVLGVILKQGVCPGRTLALLVDGVGRGSCRAAPDGAAAGSV